MSFLKNICFFLLLLASNCFGQTDIEHNLTHGNYNKVISACEKQLLEATTSFEKFRLHEILAEAHYNMGNLSDCFENIQLLRKYNPNKKTSEIHYYVNLVSYYQAMQFSDSATYYADLVMKQYRKNKSIVDSNLTSDVYAVFANAMRNGGAYYEVIAHCYIDFEPHTKFLHAFLDTALMYANSDQQKAAIFLKIGLMYSDVVAKFKENKPSLRKIASDTSITYLNKAIALEKSPLKKARLHSLIGLNYLYLTETEKAENAFKKALTFTINNNEISYPKMFLTICNWRGWNLEELYNNTHDIKYLLQIYDIYKEGINVWMDLYKNQNNLKGKNDAYNISTLNRLVPTCLALFEITNDSSYFYEAFEYADQTKYPSLALKTTTIKDIQKLLDNKTAFVHFTYVARPVRHYAFVITQKEVTVVSLTNLTTTEFNSKKLNFLYDFNNLPRFKIWSNLFYTYYFQKVDVVLTSQHITNVVVSNSDQCSMLNLDLLISDSTSNNWKDLPYLFHKYNFSYALTARSFIKSYSIATKNKRASLGITIGNYQTETSLRFSKNLTDNLATNYQTNFYNFQQNLNNNNIALILSHGKSSYSTQNATIQTTSNEDDIINVNEIYKMNLTNDFVLFTACNSNTSQQYYGEGAIGNFSKATRYAGGKSVLTTSWDIDEKANAYIIEKLIFYLSEGLPKNEALWKAKKAYWNSCTTDEEYKPLYWAPYILTGNITPILIPKNTSFNLNWLWMLTTLPLVWLFSLRKKTPNTAL